MRFSAQASAALLLSLGSLVFQSDGLPLTANDVQRASYDDGPYHLTDEQGYGYASFDGQYQDEDGTAPFFPSQPHLDPQYYGHEEQGVSFIEGPIFNSGVDVDADADFQFNGRDTAYNEQLEKRVRVAIPNPFTMVPPYTTSDLALNPDDDEELMSEYSQYHLVWANAAQETAHKDAKNAKDFVVDVFGINKAKTGIAIFSAWNDDAKLNANANHVRLAEMTLAFWQHNTKKPASALKQVDIIEIINSQQVKVIDAALKALGDSKVPDADELPKDKPIILRASAKAGTEEHNAYQTLLTGKPFGPMVVKMLTAFLGTENLKISQFELTSYNTIPRMIVKFS